MLAIYDRYLKYGDVSKILMDVHVNTLIEDINKIDEALRCISLLPPEDVTPVVHAKWEDGKCSNCGCNFGRAFPFSIMPRFCPDCGADMRIKDWSDD